MGRPKKHHQCTECSAPSAGWAGRCSTCGAWGSIEAVSPSVAARAQQSRSVPADVDRIQALGELGTETTIPTPTGVDDFDRVMGGGLIAGSAVLLAGEPGIGKSTLTLQIAMGVASHGAGVLLVAGEEAPAQIAGRARRLGSIPESLKVLDDCGVEGIADAIEAQKPQLAVVDSIQMMRSDNHEGAPGSVAQLKLATEKLSAAARRAGTTLILVGHITKEGAIAGPKTIEHLVDTVITFSGDRSENLRYLRTIKHRFGPTTEVGLFEMTSRGLEAVADPSSRFLADRCPGLSGSVVIATLDGHRPILIELQALVVAQTVVPGSAPPVTVQGVDRKRVDIITAVLAARAGLALASHQILVSVTGGAAVKDPAADLGLALALASAAGDEPVPANTVLCGEIGLGGEIRSVPRLNERLQEAHRLGFQRAIVPPSAGLPPTGMKVLRASNLSEALRYIHGSSGRGRVVQHPGSGRPGFTSADGS